MTNNSRFGHQNHVLVVVVVTVDVVVAIMAIGDDVDEPFDVVTVIGFAR